MENQCSNNEITPGSISKRSRSQRNPLQPLNPNSLFECVRLGECTPPNFTNSGVYRNARLLVDPDAETEDCAEYQVQCSEGNLPQSPVYRTPSVGQIGRQTPRNAINIPHLPSIPTMSGQAVNTNLSSPVVVLGSSSHYRSPSVPQKSHPRSKVKENEPSIDLFGYPASPQLAKAFRARLKTLVRFYFRDVHLPWTKESDSFKFLIEALLKQFPSACWDDGVVSKAVSSILRRRRHEYRKVAARAGMKRCSYYFLL